jgi:hypothetical protein
VGILSFIRAENAAPVEAEGQQALAVLDRAVERAQTRADELAAQAQQFDREAATSRAVGEEVGRIQSEIAAEKTRLAGCKLDGTTGDTRHFAHLRSKLTTALERKAEADADADISEEAAASRCAAAAAQQSDLRILQQQRPALVRQVLAERLAAEAPAFEALRRQVVEQYIKVFSLALGHDKLSEALKAGVFFGGLNGGALRLPMPEGFSEVLDLEKFYKDVESGAIALLRELKVHG